VYSFSTNRFFPAVHPFLSASISVFL
jgi:hypothetical protein